MNQLRMTAYASLLAALTAVGAYIAIPIGPVPIVLQNLFVYLSGLLLGSRWGLMGIAAYLLAGAVGLPVFAGSCHHRSRHGKDRGKNPVWGRSPDCGDSRHLCLWNYLAEHRYRHDSRPVVTCWNGSLSPGRCRKNNCGPLHCQIPEAGYAIKSYYDFM